VRLDPWFRVGRFSVSKAVVTSYFVCAGVPKMEVLTEKYSGVASLLVMPFSGSSTFSINEYVVARVNCLMLNSVT